MVFSRLSWPDDGFRKKDLVTLSLNNGGRDQIFHELTLKKFAERCKCWSNDLFLVLGAALRGAR